MPRVLNWRELREHGLKWRQRTRLVTLERRVAELERQLADPATAQRAAVIVQQIVAGNLAANSELTARATHLIQVLRDLPLNTKL